MNEAVSADDRNWAMFSNLAGLLFLAHIPFANIVGPLIIYLKARSENTPFVEAHARRSLNFQITFSLLVIVAIVALLVTWGATVGTLVASGAHNQNVNAPLGFIVCACILVVVLFAALLANFVCCILGAIAASGGRLFHYPAIPFIRSGN